MEQWPSNEQHPGDIRAVSITGSLARAGTPIEVRLVGTPRGVGHFVIAHVRRASKVSLAESADEPGVYSGAYLAQWGDDVRDAAVTVILTVDDRVSCRVCEERVTIDTASPEVQRAEATPRMLRNGDLIRLTAVSEPGCRVVADVRDLDSTRETVRLREDPRRPGMYRMQQRIRAANTSANGHKRVSVVATDAAGNASTPCILEVELQNPELGIVRGLDEQAADLLLRVGVVTLRDLRRMDITHIARETGLTTQELEHHQAAAKLLALGLGPDLAQVLVEHAGILGPAQLAVAAPETIQAAIQAGVEDGALPASSRLDEQFSSYLISAAVAVTTEQSAKQFAETTALVTACRAACPGELSVFGCHAYLMELVRISGLNWNEVQDTFKQDFLAASSTPARRIDIATHVLERALPEDLGNPPRIAGDWEEYDRALNHELVRILVEATRKSETALAAAQPRLFDVNRPLADRNADLEATLNALEADPAYHAALVELLGQRAGIPEAELVARYPAAFDPLRTLQERSQNLEELLHLQSPAVRVREALATLARLRLRALVAQSGQSAESLRRRYYISFSPQDCTETTSCQQAVLTMQEFLAKKAYTDPAYRYPSYDEWHVQQVKAFHPENVYSHQFKAPLIDGDRELLRGHLAAAQKILDGVRMSERGDPPSPEDTSALLTSFRWRNPYYTNLTAGLDLIGECLEIDELMSEGHQAYFAEEFQLAWRYYLQAAEKIRLTSKRVSRPMGDTLSIPLWAAAGSDSFFSRGPSQFAASAKYFFEKTLLSFAEANTPAVELARGQVGLSGVDVDGTFWPMAKSGLTSDGWKAHLASFGWASGGSVQWGALTGGGLYKPSQTWRDYVLETEMSGGDFSLDLRYKDEQNGGGLGVTAWGTDVGGTAGIRVLGDPSYWGYETASIDSHSHLRLRVEVKGQTVTGQVWVQNDTQWDPVVQTPSGGLQCKIPATGPFRLSDRGAPPTCYRIRAWNLDPATGAVSDLAFLLKPPASIADRPYPLNLMLDYLFRQWTPSAPQQVAAFLDGLASKVAVSYDTDDWIVEFNVAGRKSFDPFQQPAGSAVNGLWYGDGDDRLHRENLRQLLDGLVMLLCHQFFFQLPVCLGDVANGLGQYQEALKWYRLVYDEREPLSSRAVYPYMNSLIEGQMLRIRIARNDVEWADHLFNQNTEESVQQARIHYALALQTLGTEGCCEQERRLSAALQGLSRDMVAADLDATTAEVVYRTLSGLTTLPDQQASAHALIGRLRRILEVTEDSAAKAQLISAVIAEQAPGLRPRPHLDTIIPSSDELLERLEQAERQHPEVLDDAETTLRARRVAATAQPITGQSFAPASGTAVDRVRSMAQPSLALPEESFVVPAAAYGDPNLCALHAQLVPLLSLPGKPPP